MPPVPPYMCPRGSRAEFKNSRNSCALLPHTSVATDVMKCVHLKNRLAKAKRPEAKRELNEALLCHRGNPISIDSFLIQCTTFLNQDGGDVHDD